MVVTIVISIGGISMRVHEAITFLDKICEKNKDKKMLKRQEKGILAVKLLLADYRRLEREILIIQKEKQALQERNAQCQSFA